MAGILDLIDPKLLASEAPQLSAEGEFSKGMRSGTLGMRSQASNFLGAAGNALGFEDFAKGQYADADALGMRAQAAAPRVNTWRDINSAGDLGDWAAGTLGGLVPSAAVGVGAGLMAPAAAGAAGAMLAGTAAYAPLEIGDTVARQRAAGQPVDLGDAAVAGGLSAAGQSIVPGLVAGKLAGRAVSKAPMTAARGARAVVADAGIEAGAEFGGELTKQLGSTNTLDNLDYGAAVDNAVAGALGGGVMGGAGVVGDFAHQNASKVGQGVQATKNAATGLLDRAKGAAKDVQEGPVGQAVAGAATKVGETLEGAGEKLAGYEIPTQLTDFFDSAKTKAKTVAKQVADGAEVIGDPAEFASMAKDKFKAAVGGNDGERFKAVNGMLQELASDVGLTPEQREKVTQAATDLGDRANQAVVAGVKIARDGFKRASALAERFAARIADSADKQLAAEGKSVKKSEDYSAVRQRIDENIAPVLRELRPELFEAQGPEADQALRNIGEGMRQVLLAIATNQKLPAEKKAELLQLTHGQPELLIAAAYRAIDTGDKKQAAAVLKGVDELARAGGADNALVKVLTGSLMPQHQKNMNPDEVRELANGLKKWASQGREHADDPRHALNDRAVRHQLTAYFGDQVDTVLTAVEKALPSKANALERIGNEGTSENPMESDAIGNEDMTETDPTGEGDLTTTRERTVEESLDEARFYGANKGKGPELFEAPGAPRMAKDGKEYPHATVQAIARHQSRNPGMSVQWRSAKELGFDHPSIKPRIDLLMDTYMEGEDGDTATEARARAEKAVSHLGVVTAEGSKQETRINEAELPQVTLDAAKYGDSPSRIDTVGKGKPGNVIIDAVRLTQFMEARLRSSDDRTERDNKGGQHRKARMFKEGIAAVQEHLGVSFDIPDSTVIDKLGTTWGDVVDEATGKTKRGVKNLKALGKNSEMIAKDISAKRAELAEVQAEFDMLTAGRPARKDGSLSWYPAGSPQAKALGKAQWRVKWVRTQIESLTEQKDFAEMYELLDGAGQSDGGFPSNKTISKLIDELPESKAGVAALLREKLAGRTDPNAFEGSVDDPNATQPDPFGQIHTTLEGGSNKSAVIRTNQTGLPRAQDTGARLTAPAKAVNKSDWAGWALDSVLSPPKLDDALSALKELNSTQLKGLGEYLESINTLPKGVTALRLKQMKAQVASKLATASELERTTGSGARRVDAPTGIGKGRLTDTDTSDPQKGFDSADWGPPPERVPNSLEIDNPMRTLVPYGPRQSVAKGPGEGAFGPKGQSKEAGWKPTPGPLDANMLRDWIAEADAKLKEYAAVGDNEVSPEWRKAANAGGYSSKALAKTLQERRDGWAKQLAKMEANPSPKALAAKKAALLEAASSGDPKLLKELASSTDAKALQRAVMEMTSAPVTDAEPVTEQFKARVREYFDRVLGKDALDIFFSSATLDAGKAQGMHGEIDDREAVILHDRQAWGARSTVYHESAHALFARLLNDSRFDDTTIALTKVAESENIQRQLDAIYADDPQTRAYYKANPEESIAYMYQHWAEGRLKISDKPTLTAFEKVKAFLFSFLNSLSDEQHVQTMFEFFKSGDLKAELKPLTIRDFRVAREFSHQMGFLNYGDAKANMAAAINTANERLGELVRSDENTAYGLGTKKYSLQRTGYETQKTDFARGWMRGSFPKEALGPIERAQIVTHKGYEGDIEMKVFDYSLNIEDGPVLVYDLFKNPEGKWEVGVDGPVPGTKAFDKYRSMFKTLTYGEADPYNRMEGISDADRGEHAYSKFHDGVFPASVTRKLLRTLRDHAAELGVDPEEIVFGRETGAAAGKPYVSMKREQIKRFDRTNVTPNANGPVNQKEVYDYFTKTHGQRIELEWKNFLHAGEFERVRDQIGGWKDVARLSVHSLNPLSPAYHESLHAFFAKLTDMKHGAVMDVLERAASSAPVMNQLKKLLAGEPDALRQLNNAEERAAYMYQFWASGQLQVGEQTKNVFQRIADFVRSVLGIWSNDERALEILRYFHEGDFAKDMATGRGRDAVQTKLMDSHRNAALEHARKMTEPLRNLGESLMVAGGQRLRDTGIPALRELADAMKLHGTADGEDAGYVPAARTEHAQRMNKLAKALRDTPEATLTAALESLQTKSNAAIDALAKPEDRLAARLAKKALRKHLDETFDYMRDAGVKVNDFGYGKDYFPRVYDAAYISSHQQEFKNVLARHGVNSADEVVQKLMVSNGNEFTVEVDKPGMQHLKPRKLAHIPDAELAPFMRKDVLHILSSYTSQATRRAEWARRFQDDGQGVVDLMNKAKHQGASDADLDAAQKFVRSVDGTLGDTINPEARRLMGNMIVYQNIRLLPLAIFSSVVDPMGVLVRGGTVGDAFNTFKRGVGEAVKSFKKNATDDDMTKLATDIGSIDDSMLAHTMSAIYMQGMASETGRKINDAFFRFNLMEQWNTSMRVGATQAAMGFLKRHADGKASKHSARWLNELGLQVGDVKLNAQGEVDVTDPRVKQSIIRWVDGAVLRPDAVDKPIWMSDPHFALIAHLKQFVFSFHETILKRVIHEYQHGNHAPAMALASYVPIMIAADMLKGLIQGGGSEPEWKRNWTAQDYVWSGVERAGLLGTGQFVVDGVQGGIGSLAGPTLEQLGSAVQVLGGKAQFAPFLIKSMPANALYSSAFETEPLDPRTTG